LKEKGANSKTCGKKEVVRKEERIRYGGMISCKAPFIVNL
jgi:hypothetical protein